MACSSPAAEPVGSADPEPVTSGSDPVRIVLVGDVMLGRGVGDVVELAPGEVFADVRHLIAGADIAGANLESPLTTRPHLADNPNALEADPSVAPVLAAAGFDLVSLPNNHTMDAGPEGLADTIEAVDTAGLVSVGAGRSNTDAEQPLIAGDETTVGFLAFDATGVDHPSVASWSDAESVAAVGRLRAEVDVLVVSIHGGTEYLPTNDPEVERIAGLLADVGADVVWGHGPHVIQPVAVWPDTAAERTTVVATSLGNFLFDQGGADRTTGAILEILADSRGVIAYRVALTEHPDRRVRFVGWEDPVGDAVHLHGSWWSLARAVDPQYNPRFEIGQFRHGDLLVARRGDVDGDGTEDVVASFRRPFRSTPFNELNRNAQWTDSQGRSAHLGVYDPVGLREIWVAGSVLMPIADLAVCAGSLAVVHDTLDDPAIVAAGAWTWNGFGFDTATDISGPGTAGCADVDGDGVAEPIISGRSLSR